MNEIQNINPYDIDLMFDFAIGSVFASSIIFFFIFIILLFLLPYFFFLIHLSKLFNKCNAKNRKMDGGLVWLLLIPVFNIGWIFYVIFNVRDTLKSEFNSRQIEADDVEFGFSVGLAYAITSACCIIPFLGVFCSIPTLVLWIVYWVKINKYSKILDNEIIQETTE
tara:strand:- start:1621 stop:2118 length:498 start_codon:yes stop_codon:yes gene_type:complete